MYIQLWCIINVFQISCNALKLSIKFDVIDSFFSNYVFEQNII